LCGVADPGCLSRILIFTRPGSRIPDPKTATKELLKFLNKKFSLSTQKYGFGIRDPEKPIPDPGSRGQKGTGSGSATLLLRDVHKNSLIEEFSSIIGLKYCVRYIGNYLFFGERARRWSSLQIISQIRKFVY
jgi:hypothetical protein